LGHIYLRKSIHTKKYFIIYYYRLYIIIIIIITTIIWNGLCTSIFL